MKMKRKVEKMKKYIALLLSALMVLCLFAGCGTQEIRIAYVLEGHKL